MGPTKATRKLKWKKSDEVNRVTSPRPASDRTVERWWAVSLMVAKWHSARPRVLLVEHSYYQNQRWSDINKKKVKRFKREVQILQFGEAFWRAFSLDSWSICLILVCSGSGGGVGMVLNKKLWHMNGSMKPWKWRHRARTRTQPPSANPRAEHLLARRRALKSQRPGQGNTTSRNAQPFWGQGWWQVRLRWQTSHKAPAVRVPVHPSPLPSLPLCLPGPSFPILNPVPPNPEKLCFLCSLPQLTVTQNWNKAKLSCFLWVSRLFFFSWALCGPRLMRKRIH